MKGEMESRVVPPFPESLRCFSPFQGNLFSLHCLDFQPEDRLTPRWHVGQPCGKASWESLVGKPRGKASRKATDPLIHAKGSVTVLLQLGRKAHVHAPSRDEGRVHAHIGGNMTYGIRAQAGWEECPPRAAWNEGSEVDSERKVWLLKTVTTWKGEG